MDLFKLKVQRLLGWVAYVPLGLTAGFAFNFFFRYKINNHSELRKKFRILTKEPTPLLICSNHLTFIDSIIIIWAFGATPWYFFNYRCLSWNLPAAQYSRESLFFKIFCYFSKCLFIERGGSRGHINGRFNLTNYLLKKGEVLTIFPEGTRSRTGKFNSYGLKAGAGKIAIEAPNCRILCLYLRSHKQKIFSNFPPHGSIFDIDMELLSPTSRMTGREGYAKLTGEIGTSIRRMEENYFSREAPLGLCGQDLTQKVKIHTKNY